ncbi:hypothetical protein PENSPDRAFT_687292 [Peniophora sp. CONT]|nr:hypothetical protein PENSPDRAFT_687292 [Peniophora sp. CONT]
MASYSYDESPSTSLQLHRRMDPQIGQQRVSQVIAGLPQRSSNEGWIIVHNWEGGVFFAGGWTLAPSTKIFLSVILAVIVVPWLLRNV